VRETILSPDKFVKWFNSVLPGAYRNITAQDIRDMTECGLIRCYGYYSRSDLETIRAILLYEQLREKRIYKQSAKEAHDVLGCKRCSEPLPSQPEGSKGRPKEYCRQCESLRATERYRKWRRKNRATVC